MYDYIIYGGGPTGMTLSYLLSKNKFKVLLIEKEEKLGGCWKVEWQQDKYFTEHSPRVLLKDSSSSLFKLFNQIKFNWKNETISTYGSLIETNYKILSFFLENMTLIDLIKMIGLFLGNYKNNQTVLEWSIENKISEKGKKALEVFSIALANSPNKLLVSELVGVGNFPVMFLQFKDNEKWINLLENELIKNNVTIWKNSKLLKLYQKDNKIESADILKDGLIKKVFGKYHLLTLPPLAFQELINNNKILQDNWENYNDKWVEDSYYISFGFQFHFKTKQNQDIFKKWCQTCMNKYNIIILPTSNYTNKFSYDNKIKEVWSGTIVDTKDINHLSKNQIIKIINNLLKVKPDKVTFYDGTKKVNNKWQSKDSAFSLGKSSIISQKGKIDNLETIGPHNEKGITVINKAVKIAVNWIKNNNLESFGLEESKINYLNIVIIIILIYIIWKYLEK